MTLELNFKGFENYLFEENVNGSNDVQYVFTFPNGYGASVIKNKWSYGHRADLWELAVLKFSGEDLHHISWHLCYDTDITDDVVGHLTDVEVRELLEKISKLDCE